MLKVLSTLLLLSIITACSSKTQVSGVVSDQAGRPIPNVLVTLGFTSELQSKTHTDMNGSFMLFLKETCYILCAGGDPELIFFKDGLQAKTTYAPRFGNTKYKIILKSTIQ